MYCLASCGRPLLTALMLSSMKTTVRSTVCYCLLQVTFADTLGAAKHQEDSEVNSKNEAKKLAFYLFWNIKPSFNRSALPSHYKRSHHL